METARGCNANAGGPFASEVRLIADAQYRSANAQGRPLRAEGRDPDPLN
jgi:hypothetical protein